LFDKTDIYEHQNHIINAITETEDRERLRFSEDLHDDLGPLLSSIRVYAHLIQTKTPEQQKERVELIEFTKQLIDDAIQQTRNISYNIMPDILSFYGLVPSIKTFCQKINKTNQIDIHIITEAFNENERFDSKLELALYRAIKELINNTIKHARAKVITIRFFKTNEFHAIELSDDGIGFEFSDKVNEGNGLGLRNIIHRLQSVNGMVHFNTIPGSGTTVLMRW
jgi:signal transduction histidine kinase